VWEGRGEGLRQGRRMVKAVRASESARTYEAIPSRASSSSLASHCARPLRYLPCQEEPIVRA
jgi:hypothetical protein